MKKIMLSASIILLAVYSFLVGAMYLKQDSMVFFPEREISQTPQNIKLHYDDITFRTKDGFIISGWYIPIKDKLTTVIFCHGNAGNLSNFLEHMKTFNELQFNVLAFDYRGFGKSEGSLSEEGTYLDAEAAWDFLVTEYKKDPQDIVVAGYSIGGAIATELAVRKKVAALVVKSSFTSLPDLAQKYYPWLPVRLISKYAYATVDKVDSISCPKLFIHSPDDEIVPFEHGKKLYKKASQPKDFLVIRGGHNDGLFVSGRVYNEGLMQFFEKYNIIR